MRARAALRKSRRRGSAAVELAVLLPFLAGCFLIAIDWCRIYYTAITLDDCARNGAIAACGVAYNDRNKTVSEREQLARTEALRAELTAAAAGRPNLDPPLEEGDVTAAVTGNEVTVTINYTFRTITNYPGIGGDWPLVRTVTMRVAP